MVECGCTKLVAINVVHYFQCVFTNINACKFSAIQMISRDGPKRWTTTHSVDTYLEAFISHSFLTFDFAHPVHEYDLIIITYQKSMIGKTMPSHHTKSVHITHTYIDTIDGAHLNFITAFRLRNESNRKGARTEERERERKNGNKTKQ